MTHQMLGTVSMAAWSGNINLDEKVRACHFFCENWLLNANNRG